MREILFRGKDSSTNYWCYGSLIVRAATVAVRHKIYFLYEVGAIGIGYKVRVIPETVGQYTGLKDKDGRKIFEGDIVRFVPEEDDLGLGQYEDRAVYYECCSFIAGDYCLRALVEDGIKIEVKGNIHDNPELLKEGA